MEMYMNITIRKQFKMLLQHYKMKLSNQEFIKELFSNLSDIDGCSTIAEDILIYVRNQEDY